MSCLSALHGLQQVSETACCNKQALIVACRARGVKGPPETAAALQQMPGF